MIISGTGRVIAAGLTTVTWISTLTAGYDALSTCPARRRSVVAFGPATPSFVSVTVHVTFGACAGTRP
jgi:hypothetical protein